MFEAIPFAVAMSPVVRVADPPGPRNDSAAKLAMVGVLTPGPVAMDLLTHIQIRRLDDVERTEYLVAWERAARWVEAQRMKAVGGGGRGHRHQPPSSAAPPPSARPAPRPPGTRSARRRRAGGSGCGSAGPWRPVRASAPRPSPTSRRSRCAVRAGRPPGPPGTWRRRTV